MEDAQRILAVDLREVQVDEVKFKADSTRIDFRARTPNGSETFRVDSHIEQPESMKEMRIRLERHLLDLCEIPADDEHETEITGCAFKWDDGVMGAVLKGKRSYRHSLGALSLNSPVRYVTHDAPERTFEPEQAEALKAFHAACVDFVEKVGGPPDQLDIFDEAEKEEGVQPEPAMA